MTTWRRARWWIPVLLLVAALCGCAAITSTIGALSSDGFESPSVTINTDSTATTVTVGATRHRTLPDDAAVDRAAELVWRTSPIRLDRVEAEVGGRGAVYDRDQLTAAFGPRDPALDSDTAGSSVVSALIWIAAALVAVVLATVVLIVVLVRRSRRRRAASPPGPPVWPGPWGPGPGTGPGPGPGPGPWSPPPGPPPGGPPR